MATTATASSFIVVADPDGASSLDQWNRTLQWFESQNGPGQGGPGVGTMIIQGQDPHPRCPSCKGAMNKAAVSAEAEIHYVWGSQTWSAGGG